MLAHGLSGSHLSGYVVRIARLLHDCGVRTFRLDHRGCGTGRKLARLPYNAGRSDDVRRAVHAIRAQCPESIVHLAGFSLSGNILLKLLGESADLPDGLGNVIAVNPPIDLEASVERIKSTAFGIYDRYFARTLFDQVRDSSQWREDLLGHLSKPPRHLRDFDELFTAPASGYANGADYYADASATRYLPDVTHPALILTAADDPMVPVDLFGAATLPPCVTLQIESSGGHVGYIGRLRDGSRRWLDRRVVSWLTSGR